MGSAQDKQEIRSKWEILLNSERTDVRWKIMDEGEILLSQTLEKLQRRRRNGDDVQWTKCLLNESSVLKEEYTSLRTKLNPETPEGESADLETELAELCMERCKLLEICCDRLKHYETPIIPILKSKYTYIKSRALVDKSSAICAKQLSKMAIGQSYNSSQGGQPLVSSDPHKYEMSGKRLALMLCVLNRREGALNDIRIMRTLFQSYGFDYTIEINPTAKEILEAVQRFRDRISSSLEDISCCFVVTASHGNLGIIVGSDEEQVNLNGIIKLFDNDKCPKLRKKPKVFIVQACRGESCTLSETELIVGDSFRCLTRTSSAGFLFTACERCNLFQGRSAYSKGSQAIYPIEEHRREPTLSITEVQPLLGDTQQPHCTADQGGQGSCCTC